MAALGLDLFDVELDLVKGDVVTFNDDDTRFVVVDEKTKRGGVFVRLERHLSDDWRLDALQECWFQDE